MEYKKNTNQNPLSEQIIKIKKLKFEELIDTIKKERPKEIDLPYIGLKKISKIANWYEVKIPNNVIKNIILLHHPRCQLCFFPRMLTHLYNNAELVPKYGATIEKTIKRLEKFQKKYGQRRSKCHQLIKNYNGKNLDHILLSDFPIPFLKRHKKIKWDSTSLLQIDGAHRLLSLYYPKKINFEYVNCFLATIDENLT